jgi:hypothetical protein
MKSNALIAIALVSALASTAAVADGATYELPQPITSQTSRADVMAELLANRTQSMAWSSEASALPMQTTASLYSRAEVRDQAVAAVADGSARWVGADDNSFAGHQGPRYSVSVRMAQASR